MALSVKLLAPLATVAVAGAVAIGSGATFTSQTNNTISAVTSGTLSQANTKADAAVFNLKDMKPGDTLNGGLTITNTGSLPAKFTLAETASANGFAGSNLTLTIKNVTTNKVVFDGTFGALVDNEKQDLGAVAAGAANQYAFTVKLAQDADNTQQGKTASASYQWASTQLDGETTNQ